ncbi:hypothetical protein [Changpingibacter yushuensis]|uniref:hypothetical protein n=1 Tax=Changpingibacter yushuensis TaxID=2758440 RepID=UPI00165E92F8|nr:hypothetical protein [Changpingibacter yushuensis]
MNDSTIQQLATRMIPERVRWGLLLIVFCAQALLSATLTAYGSINLDAPSGLGFAAAFLLAISAPVTLLAAVNVTKSPSTADSGESPAEFDDADSLIAGAAAESDDEGESETEESSEAATV